MSKKAIFEVATLADAVAKAFRVAPNKGAAFDKASGIQIEVDPFNFEEPVVIKSTNLDVTFRQSVSVLEVGDERVVWRVHARLVQNFMSQLPTGLGSSVKLQEMTPNSDSHLYFICGKIKAKLRLVEGGYPNIASYDKTLLGPVPDLSKRLNQVAWATDPQSQGVLAGVHMDGAHLMATNKACMVMVPCIVPVDAPVTAPLLEIASLIKNTGEASLRADGLHLQVSPDAWTQTTCVMYNGEYPNLPKLVETFNPKFDHKFTVDAEPLKSAIGRSLVLVKEERYPRTEVEITNGVMRLTVDVPDVGKISDEIEVIGGQLEGEEPFKFLFSPLNMKSAVEASGRSVVQIDYGPTPLSPIKVTDDNGFVCIMMPIRHTE